jgi:protein-S-isoprenylcysteine O-methyltransferase Ste14
MVLLEILMNKRVARITINLAVFWGWASLLVFLIFLVIGPMSPLNLGLGPRPLLWFDAGLSLLFFVQHSVMIRRSFRRLAARLMPEYYVGALYTVASAVVLLVVVALWQESEVVIVSAKGIARWLVRAVPLVAIAGFVWGVRSLGSFDAFGVGPIVNRLKGRDPRLMPLSVAGPYRWVRHPLYLFMILLIWAYPNLTADRLLFNILWTAWIVVGTVLEERDLVAEFGDSYRRYQKRVPMLVPYRVPGGDAGGDAIRHRRKDS